MGADMRDSSIDFVKGCAIILMVFGHAGYCGVENLDKFVNLFHKPMHLGLLSIDSIITIDQ